MQRIHKTLNANIKKYKLEDKLKTVEALRCWEKIVSEFFPNAKGKTMALSLKNGVLTVAVLARELAESIRICAKRIIYELNRKIGKTLVYAISCQD